jgi:hypothetical protein
MVPAVVLLLIESVYAPAVMVVVLSATAVSTPGAGAGMVRWAVPAPAPLAMEMKRLPLSATLVVKDPEIVRPSVVKFAQGCV